MAAAPMCSPQRLPTGTNPNSNPSPTPHPTPNPNDPTLTLTLTLTITRYLVYQPEGEPLSLPLPKDVAAPRRGEQI